MEGFQAELRRMALGPEGRKVQVAKAVYSFGVTRGCSFRCTNSQDGNDAGTIEKVEGLALVQWDSGSKNICRVGHDAAYGLRIADKAIHKKAKTETVDSLSQIRAATVALCALALPINKKQQLGRLPVDSSLTTASTRRGHISS